jgi:hypothetical protein
LLQVQLPPLRLPLSWQGQFFSYLFSQLRHLRGDLIWIFGVAMRKVMS